MRELDQPLSFDIDAEPVPYARMRATWKTKTLYSPKRQQDYKKAVATLATVQMKKFGWQPTSLPIELHITCHYVKPKSWSAKKRNSPQFKTGKPDIDNLAKIIMDALNGVVWHDDAQIIFLTVSKDYSLKSVTYVRIVPIAPED
jgi:Holliday junction resolvase RusA-like endonuclease